MRSMGMGRPSDVLVAGLRGRLVGALVLSTGDRGLAEEVAQEALAKAVVHWGRVGAMQSPEGWVFRTAFNTLRSQIRRRGAERRAYAKTAARPSVDVPGLDEDVGVRLALRDAVLGLPERQRQVVAARFYADLSVVDTARAMRCAEGTVKSLTSKALANLRLSGVMEEVTDG